MKICFANILYSQKHERGGLGAHIADLSAELSRCGHDVTIITSGQASAHFENGVRVVSLGNVPRFSRPRQTLNPIYLLQRLSYMLRMTRYVLKSGFDIVEAAEGGFEQLFLVLIRKSLTITKLHGNFRHIYSSTTSLGRIMEKLEAFAARRSDGIYTSSLAYARSISNEYKIPLERIKIIPYGIDLSGLDNFETQDLRQRYPTIANKKVIFLTVGSSPERKGARIFVEAAKRVEESQLMFVLSCSDPRFFEAPELPQNLLILPNLERAEFYNWLAQSDVIVFPSQFESFSIAVREAMLFGKAIVVSPQIPFEGVDTEYPRHYILPAIEPALLANAVLEITNGGSNFPAVGPEFHSRLKNNYDIRRVAQATLDFYKEVAGTAKAG